MSELRTARHQPLWFTADVRVPALCDAVHFSALTGLPPAAHFVEVFQ
jgi:hypothetical protein